MLNLILDSRFVFTKLDICSLSSENYLRDDNATIMQWRMIKIENINNVRR